MTYVKRRKGWRMSCDVEEVTERLENEQAAHGLRRVKFFFYIKDFEKNHIFFFSSIYK